MIKQLNFLKIIINILKIMLEILKHFYFMLNQNILKDYFVIANIMLKKKLLIIRMLLVDMNNLKKIKMLLKMKCQKKYIEECIYDYGIIYFLYKSSKSV